MSRALLGCLLAALAVCPGALGHGGGVPGFTSTVTGVIPAIAGVSLTVLDGDDRLELRNQSDREVVVLGYDGEPYLRFSSDGVYRNRRSPATYLNDDRYGNVQLPATADPNAEPEWEKVSSRRVYEWHDHRIHWMSEIGPPQVRADPDGPHHVFDWSVPGSAAGEPFTVAGSLDYAPADSGRPAWIYLALPLLALVIAAGAWIAIRRRGAGSRA